MGKYLITGRPGSGKTSVIHALQSRGYIAYDTDVLDDVTKLQRQSTGEIVPWPDGPVDWKEYVWNWQADGLNTLLNTQNTVFLGAIVANQKEYYSLFDKVFALTLSTDTLEQRLDSHEHQRTDAEKEKAKAVHDIKQARWVEQGLILISSERPVSIIIDDILSRL